ncbi:MAG: Uma2 family endonuclease [bacterium]|nr:Uma2 family endonuclease [bacterium]
MAIAAMPIRKEVKYTYDDYLIWDIGSDKRYELIGGEFFMAPAPNIEHQRSSRKIDAKIVNFLERLGVGEVFYAPCDVVLSNEDVVQPDIIFVSKENFHIITKDNIKGSPDLLIEIISKSSAQMDRIIKKRLYERCSVKEYWLVDVDNKEIEVFTLTQTGYETYGVFKAEDTLSSVVLKDFNFNVTEVFSRCID